jgi:hypothetical protein
MHNITFEESWFDSWQGKSFFSTLRCSDFPWRQDGLLFNVYQGLFPRDKGDPLPAYGVEIKNNWNYIF